ncbi:hypothetical protein GGS23DRAFT_549837 [Durotheca rogersii]|uniref:uncharacterized protein n=1 Tax=Durotheca rogersii TaxID=419775 RepID=UPI00221FAA26|nr:uncharacterized protein GGS23DRAFT_549837 [Durotheca rogersii]KAI5867761.1 hypothetical protein GGS23DRAFT_549837 [Durotheca rogersii]
MAFPPIVSATVQSAALAATSNLLAQGLTAYRNEAPLIIDWTPVFQFVLYALVNVPPNFLWQDFLESTFPSAPAPSPGPDTQDAKARPREAAGAAPPKLHLGNTAAKLALDQTVGAAANTVLFSVFMHSLQAAMARPAGGGYGRVDWAQVAAASRAEFVPLLVAGWRLWPLVSLVNFAFVRSVPARNLVAALAGVAWGIYVSLVAAR